MSAAKHDPALAAEEAARKLAADYADAIDGIMPRGDGRDTLLTLLAIAWLEGSKAGLIDGARITERAINSLVDVLA